MGMVAELENPVSNLEGQTFLCSAALGVMFSLKQPPVMLVQAVRTNSPAF